MQFIDMSCTDWYCRTTVFFKCSVFASTPIPVTWFKLVFSWESSQIGISNIFYFKLCLSHIVPAYLCKCGLNLISTLKGVVQYLLGWAWNLCYNLKYYSLLSLFSIDTEVDSLLRVLLLSTGPTARCSRGGLCPLHQPVPWLRAPDADGAPITLPLFPGDHGWVQRWVTLPSGCINGFFFPCSILVFYQCDTV